MHNGAWHSCIRRLHNGRCIVPRISGKAVRRTVTVPSGGQLPAASGAAEGCGSDRGGECGHGIVVPDGGLPIGTPESVGSFTGCSQLGNVLILTGRTVGWLMPERNRFPTGRLQ